MERTSGGNSRGGANCDAPAAPYSIALRTSTEDCTKRSTSSSAFSTLAASASVVKLYKGARRSTGLASGFMQVLRADW